MKAKAKIVPVCEDCSSQNLKSRVTTYPLQLGPRRVDVGRVAVKECLDCHHLMPTAAGKEKLNRCLGTLFHMFERAGINPV
jgi:hypothetical protein